MIKTSNTCMFKGKNTLLLITAIIICSSIHCFAKEKPLMKDFIGLNGHFKFKPELYSQVCRLVRNYHNINWDVTKPGDKITFPVCVNKVNWDNHVYGKWAKHGFESDICAMFGSFGRGNPDFEMLWKGKEKWSYEYGRKMAEYFGPSGNRKLCTSIEIGNEPGNEFNDKLYRTIFTNMAQGIRKGDPKMKIVTCTAHSGTADKYSKSLEETFTSPTMRKLYDVINVHTYAMKPKKKDQSPWDRSYPEDPAIEYLKIIDRTIDWRNKNAREKEVWVTEFGWDACTDDVIKNRTGWFKKLNWMDVSDLQQAQYLVRSILCFAERDIDRAYIYYYDDDNKPSVHAAAGLTRKFKPKISFWAVKHLYETLGDYRFNRLIRKNAEKLYVYEFKHGKDPKRLIWAIWSPTGRNNGSKTEVILEKLPGTPVKAEHMAIKDGIAREIPWKSAQQGRIRIKINESPTYLTIKARASKGYKRRE